ncbi:MAG TPA: rRNA adenine N-6-methyltransferase family protein [Victivallales bacterium]|nr:rRNA adenine N-6-methyltransferase family protein [Victivallales bacterium]
MKLAIIKEFIKSPTTVGTIMPSSSYLADAITSSIGLENADVVVEIGPGSGAFTGHILYKLKKGSKFLMIELNRDFYDRLKKKYPDLKIINDTAENLTQLLLSEGITRADVIISGLPWAVFSSSLQISILKQVHNCLVDGGRFATYAYFQGCFLPSGKRFRKTLKDYFSDVQRFDLVVKNFPPAYVYRCIK